MMRPAMDITIDLTDEEEDQRTLRQVQRVYQ